jgi:hypothetical protein
MLKKILVVLLLAAVVGTGAFAQLMFGVTGALHMDSQLSADEIMQKFQDGEGIFYGPFAEIAFNKLGFGASANFSFYDDLGMEFMEYDANAYASYHLFGAKAFLDPFGEVGFGMIANDFANSDEDPMPDAPNAANLYWYGALGAGLNLGSIGIFGKLSYNNRIDEQLTFQDEFGNDVKVPYYGEWYFDGTDWVVDPYVPNLRFTLGVKIIL